MDLPREDASAGPAEYARAAADALLGAREVVLVGHSLGGITIPNVAALAPVSRLVYLAALVPQGGRPWDETHLDGVISSPAFDAAVGERPDGSAVLHQEAADCLYPDAPRELALRAWERCGPQTWGITQKASLDFPATPAAYIICRNDVVVLPDWSRRTAREQLGVEPLEIDGDHSPFLARPAELAELLVSLA